MARILVKKRLSSSVWRMSLSAPDIATSRKAGQFVIVMVDDNYAERIPLTIADADPSAGSIDIIFQAVGGSTQRLAALEVGQEIAHLLGPLGKPTQIEPCPAGVVCVGGGIGAAPMYPIVQAERRAGNRVTVILGARNKDLLIMEDEMRAAADEVVVTTDDGSYGRKALVTEPLKEICTQRPPSEVIAIGPPIMMKFCAETTRPFGIHTVASLNTIMVDGTGMCGGCRVTVAGQTKFVCVDGPEFDAHQVDFDSMMRRLSSYREDEEHACRITQMAAGASERRA